MTSLDEFLGNYRPRPTTPRLYRRHSCVTRRVVTYWPGLKEPWPPLNTGCLDVDLVVVQGVAVTPAEVGSWKERVRSFPSFPHLLLGLPLLSMPPGASKSGLRHYFSYDNFNWYLGGHPYTFSPQAKTRGSRLTAVLTQLYHSSPARLPCGLEPFKQIVRGLLLNRGKIKVGTAQLQAKKGGDRFYRTLKDFFLASDLLKGTDSGLGWTELSISGLPPEGDGESWLAFLLQTLYGQPSGQGTPISLILEKLARPPYGVRGALARHLIAIAASCHLGSLGLESSSGAPQDDSMLSLLEGAQGKLVFRPASPAELLFLRSLRQLFRPLVDFRGDLALDPWEQTRKDLLQWYAELPTWTRLHRESHSGQAVALLKICQEAQTSDSRAVFRTLVPEAFRWKEIPSAADQAYLIDQINVSRLELEGFLGRFKDRLTVTIHHCLVGGEPTDLATSRDWLLSGRRNWLAGFLLGTFEGPIFSPWGEGLLSALQGPEATNPDSDLEERWFVQLPRDLGLAPVREWETDHSRLFRARIGRAKLEIELGRFHQFFSTFAGPRKVESLKNWLHQILTADDVPSEVAEEILALVLDELE